MKRDLGITQVFPNKPKTLAQYIEYRNTLLIRAKARTEKFQDKGHNYYWLRIKMIDLQYPEFKGLGIIKIKD